MQVSPTLREDIRCAINDAYYNARNDGLTMTIAAIHATNAVVELIENTQALVTTEDGVPTSVKVV